MYKMMLEMLEFLWSILWCLSCEPSLLYFWNTNKILCCAGMWAHYGMVWIRKIVAKGQVYPSRDGILHGLPMEPGFVKVQVDTVEEGCSAFPVATPTDEVKTLHEALGGQFIQWIYQLM